MKHPLYERRYRAHISARRLAKEIGVSPAALSRWENLDRKPKPENLAAWKVALEKLRKAS